MTTVYQVANKVFSILFVSKESAEAFVRAHSTVANGLQVIELQIFP